MAEQLAFDLPVRTALGREDFLVSPANQTALATLDAWPGWPLGMCVLCGPVGSGKTHLAHVWAGMTGARIVAAGDVTAPDALAGGPLIVEDIDAGGADETQLFHLFNLQRSEAAPTLFTALQAPAQIVFDLPDLASRLRALPVAALAPPDDALLQAVMVKQFADRQLHVPPTVLTYLARRIERSFAAARDVVAELDAAALAEGRPVTRGLAARILDKLDGDGA